VSRRVDAARAWPRARRTDLWHGDGIEEAVQYARYISIAASIMTLAPDRVPAQSHPEAAFR
jgi:hypothetical protein